LNQSTEIRAGQRVGNYTLHELVGRGACGQVWRATHHERPERVVAIKIATDPQYARQLRRDARRPELSHPHIVRVIDSDTLGDPPYLVMPYYSGGSLAKLIRAHPTGLPEERVERLLADVLEGLSAAHAVGLLHCDIKPHNILLDEQGRAALADFGLAWRPPGQPGASVCQSASLERERQTLAGTLVYLAPEVLDGAQPSASSDVYSLAVVLFEMLTGRRPAGPELPSQVRRDLRQSVAWDGLYWWASCAAEQRYADAGRMLAALRGGPRPAPRGPGADVQPPPLPEPAPLPDDLWEALALRYHEYQQACASCETLDAELAQKLTICAEHHPEVCALRFRQSALAKYIRECLARLAEVCTRIAGQLGARIQAAETRRAILLEQGCLKNHPDVRALDAQIDELRTLQLDVQYLPEELSAKPALCDRRGRYVMNSLLNTLEAWVCCRAADTPDRYAAFLTQFGKEPSNPWAEAAAARGHALADRQRKQVAREARWRRVRDLMRAAWFSVFLGALVGLGGDLIELGCSKRVWMNPEWASMAAATKAGGALGAALAFSVAAATELRECGPGWWIGVVAGLWLARSLVARRQGRRRPTELAVLFGAVIGGAIGGAMIGATVGAIVGALVGYVSARDLAFRVRPTGSDLGGAIRWSIFGASVGALGGTLAGAVHAALEGVAVQALAGALGGAVGGAIVGATHGAGDRITVKTLGRALVPAASSAAAATLPGSFGGLFCGYFLAVLHALFDDRAGESMGGAVVIGAIVGAVSGMTVAAIDAAISEVRAGTGSGEVTG